MTIIKQACKFQEFLFKMLGGTLCTNFLMKYSMIKRAINPSKIITIVLICQICQSSYGNKQACTVLRNSSLKCTSCKHRETDKTKFSISVIMVLHTFVHVYNDHSTSKPEFYYKTLFLSLSDD